MMTEPHIFQAFDRDLEAVQALIMKMGGMVEAAILDAAQALETRDEELAEQVRRNDAAIDALEERIQAEAARLIALRSPTATDLRTVLTVIKIAAALERCGDYAKNLAKRSVVLGQLAQVGDSTGSIRRMANAVELLLKDALDSYIHRDAQLAADVRQRDREVDQMYNALFREFLTHMMEDPRNITACMHLHFIAKNIERMGDHATLDRRAGDLSGHRQPARGAAPEGRHDRNQHDARREGRLMSPADQPVVLLVEDEPAQREVLSYNLESEGFRVVQAGNGDEALMLVEEAGPDVIVLDWMLPSVSGIEVCRQLKSRPSTRSVPIIMLSARSEEVDRVRGLETGADDYVVKPYSVVELMARVRSQLRRARPSSVGLTLEFEDIRLDPETHKVHRGAQLLKLGPTEFRLLSTFMEKPGRVWSREQLLDRVWGRDIYVDSRTVDVHVGRLRKALCLHGGEDPVRTVRGAGYALG